MEYTWITNLFIKQPAMTTAYQEEWQATKMMLDDKMTAMLATDKTGRPILTLKLPPNHNASLQEHYHDKIVPGYYMNKIHWSSIYLDTDIPHELIEELIVENYQTVFQSLTKKKQTEILDKK